MTATDLMPRVEKGATWLDTIDAEWFNKIDLGTLNLDDCARCVLGQLFADFDHGVALLIGVSKVVSWHPEAGQHGFAATLDDGMRLRAARETFWDALRDAWITAILTRRHAQIEHQQEAAGDGGLSGSQFCETEQKRSSIVTSQLP